VSLYHAALESMSTLIKASTTSMTSVPKPLKFLRKHYQTMKDIHEKIADPKVKQFCADVVSVLAMTCTEGRDCLTYKLLGLGNDIGEWGHEYVRHLSGEIAEEW
jgi:26S proteasome regulatory subunit N1